MDPGTEVIGPTGPPAVVVRPEPLTSPVVQALIADLDDDLTRLYPDPDQRHFGLDEDDVHPRRGALLVAWLDGEPVGCGALRTIEPGVGELKRMFVRPEQRGRGVGGALVEGLIAEARRRQLRRLLLETGIHQEPALRLYQRYGFTNVPCWGEYVASAATSRCFALDLEDPKRSPPAAAG